MGGGSTPALWCIPLEMWVVTVMDTPVISLGFAVILRQRTSCTGTHAVVLTELQNTKPVQFGQQKCPYWKHL